MLTRITNTYQISKKVDLYRLLNDTKKILISDITEYTILKETFLQIHLAAFRYYYNELNLSTEQTKTDYKKIVTSFIVNDTEEVLYHINQFLSLLHSIYVPYRPVFDLEVECRLYQDASPNYYYLKFSGGNRIILNAAIATLRSEISKINSKFIIGYDFDMSVAGMKSTTRQNFWHRVARKEYVKGVTEYHFDNTYAYTFMNHHDMYQEFLSCFEHLGHLEECNYNFNYDNIKNKIKTST